MKKGYVVFAAILIIALVCGGFYYINSKRGASSAENGDLTEVQKIITKDLVNDYPNTPREVVKLYNRILDSFYDDSYSEEEFEALCDQSLALFDDELRANNPRASYLESVKADIDSFHQEKKTMTQVKVCDSNDVKYIKDENDQIAMVDASYFVKSSEDKSFTKTYQTYMLRKDSDGKWKILGWSLTNSSNKED